MGEEHFDQIQFDFETYLQITMIILEGDRPNEERTAYFHFQLYG